MRQYGGSCAPKNKEKENFDKDQRCSWGISVRGKYIMFIPVFFVYHIAETPHQISSLNLHYAEKVSKPRLLSYISVKK